jgi:hypothetical protein
MGVIKGEQGNWFGRNKNHSKGFREGVATKWLRERLAIAPFLAFGDYF